MSETMLPLLYTSVKQTVSSGNLDFLIIFSGLLVVFILLALHMAITNLLYTRRLRKKYR